MNGVPSLNWDLVKYLKLFFFFRDVLESSLHMCPQLFHSSYIFHQTPHMIPFLNLSFSLQQGNSLLRSEIKSPGFFEYGRLGVKRGTKQLHLILNWD